MAFSSWFLPGYKAGGPIRVLANIIQQLEQDFCFKVVTRDRDLGDDKPFANIRGDCWTKVGSNDVKYLGIRERTPWVLRNIIRKNRPDLIYLNSFFDPAFSLIPLFLGRFRLLSHDFPIVIAPRGEFAPAALAIKSRRKALFCHIAKIIGLCKRVIWQAGSEHEARDIHQVWGEEAEVVIAPDLPPCFLMPADERGEKRKVLGSVRAVFLSRLAPIKNLLGALQMLITANTPIQLDIYGPMEDTAYWETCQQCIALLPKNISVRYLGPIENSEVGAIFSQYDLLYLPTLGESFGHVILEALLAGCPVLISDQTPWHGLEEDKAGWVVPLDNPGQFRDILHRVAQMDTKEYLPWHHGARRYALKICNNQASVASSRNLFKYAIEKR
jgi:glycosyltransferase involved in cell wall biosynthesis